MFQKEDNRMSLEFVIIQALNEIQVVSKINSCLFVIGVLDKKKISSEELQELKKQLLGILNDKDKYREINLRDALVKDETLAYFGKDFGKDDALRYRADIEELIQKINMMLIEAYALAYVTITGKTGKTIDLEGVDSGAVR